jgi:hypothetical protein
MALVSIGMQQCKQAVIGIHSNETVQYSQSIGVQGQDSERQSIHGLSSCSEIVEVGCTRVRKVADRA